MAAMAAEHPDDRERTAIQGNVPGKREYLFTIHAVAGSESTVIVDNFVEGYEQQSANRAAARRVSRKVRSMRPAAVSRR